MQSKDFIKPRHRDKNTFRDKQQTGYQIDTHNRQYTYSPVTTNYRRWKTHREVYNSNLYSLLVKLLPRDNALFLFLNVMPIQSGAS